MTCSGLAFQTPERSDHRGRDRLTLASRHLGDVARTCIAKCAHDLHGEWPESEGAPAPLRGPGPWRESSDGSDQAPEARLVFARRRRALAEARRHPFLWMSFSRSSTRSAVARSLRQDGARDWLQKARSIPLTSVIRSAQFRRLDAARIKNRPEFLAGRDPSCFDFRLPISNRKSQI